MVSSHNNIDLTTPGFTTVTAGGALSTKPLATFLF